MSQQSSPESAEAEYERLMFGVAERAYFKACETSDPEDWLQAGLMAQQHRNALTKARAAFTAAQPVPDRERIAKAICCPSGCEYLGDSEDGEKCYCDTTDFHGSGIEKKTDAVIAALPGGKRRGRQVSKLDLVNGWSCDERNRSACRNPHGCHCREITALRVQADSEVDPADLWDRYCKETPKSGRTPQGAMAFAVDALSRPQCEGK